MAETLFDAYTLRKEEEVYVGLAVLGHPTGRQEDPKGPQECPRWDQNGWQERPKRAFEHKTSKTSEITIISMKMLDFEGRGELKIIKFQSRNSFESKNSINQCKKVVLQGLRKAI